VRFKQLCPLVYEVLLAAFLGGELFEHHRCLDIKLFLDHDSHRCEELSGWLDRQVVGFDFALNLFDEQRFLVTECALLLSSDADKVRIDRSMSVCRVADD